MSGEFQHLSETELQQKLLEIVERLGLKPEQRAEPSFQLPSGDLDLVCLQVEPQVFALCLSAVTEVIRMVKLTALPGVPPAMVGLLNIRRRVMPVIDLRLLLSLPFKPYHENTPIVIVEENGKRCGLIVDSVHEVIKAPATDLQSPVGLIPHSEYLLTLVRNKADLIMVLDHNRLLQSVMTQGWEKLLSPGNI